MNAIDHTLAALFVVVLPAWSAWECPAVVRRLEAGEKGVRVREYAWTVAIQWAAAIGLLVHWIRAERELASLGLVWPTTTWAAAGSALLSVAVVAFFGWQARTVHRSESARAQLLAQMAAQPAARALIPRSDAEARWFTAVSLTAGLCEELFYRGFLLWYCASFLDRGPAAVVAAVAFGVAHAYQGWRGVLSTGLVGAVEMGVYLLTGSLLAPIVMHMTVDVASGHMARRALRDPAPAA